MLSHRFDFQIDVDAIEQRAQNAFEVALDLEQAQRHSRFASPW